MAEGEETAVKVDPSLLKDLNDNLNTADFSPKSTGNTDWQ
jgi:hypothetical protein